MSNILRTLAQLVLGDSRAFEEQLYDDGSGSEPYRTPREQMPLNDDPTEGDGADPNILRNVVFLERVSQTH